MTFNDFLETLLKRWGISLALLVGGLVIIVLVVWAQPSQSNESSQPLYTVRRGPLTISITESGNIKPREQEILKSEVEGKTTIIQLVPEGKFVKAGDLLVVLDDSELRDDRVEQQIDVQNAEADFIKAREDLEVAKSLAKTDISKAELDYRFAKEDVKQYLDGEYPRQLKEAESRITLAREEQERAIDKLKWSETLFKEKYISQTELQADRLTRNRFRLDYELAVASSDLLKNFTYKRQVAELESNVEQTRMILERVRRKAQADIVQAEASFKAEDLEFKQQKDKLEKVEQQIEKAKIRAPVDGMVVYATSAKGSWRGNQEPLDEGYVVREREELIYLPTADAMVAHVKVNEANLDKIKVGLSVKITVDALPGEVFNGRVAVIAPLPDAQLMWLNPDLKVYNTQIYLERSHKGLRTGLSCQAEIIVDSYTDVVYVPVQAIIRVGEQPTAFIPNGRDIEARPVELGLDNNRMVRIISGLTPGEKVLLAPPLMSGAMPVDREMSERPKRQKKEMRSDRG